MTCRERALIGVPLFIGMITIGSLTLYIAVGAVEAAFWWSLFLSLGCAVGFLLVVWADRRAARDRSLEAKPGPSAEMLRQTDTISNIDTWIPVAVPCDPDIADEMKQAVAEGWRLSQVPGLEKPRER